MRDSEKLWHCAYCNESIPPGTAREHVAREHPATLRFLGEEPAAMGTVMTQVALDAPVMAAWNRYKRSDDYANTRRWAIEPEHVDGSLWAAFETGFRLAMKAAASLPSPEEQDHRV